MTSNYVIHNHYLAHVQELEEDDECSSLFLSKLQKQQHNKLAIIFLTWERTKKTMKAMVLIVVFWRMFQKLKRTTS
jgi:hypothetical protein